MSTSRTAGFSRLPGRDIEDGVGLVERNARTGYRKQESSGEHPAVGEGRRDGQRAGAGRGRHLASPRRCAGR